MAAETTAAGTSVMARLRVDAATARALSDILAEQLAEAAVAAYEDRDGWVIELHFKDAPDERQVGVLIGEFGGNELARQVVFKPVAARDWVQASLRGLPPVLAGRFFVHGSHDRSRVPANRIGIEIEAALAFGSGHHGTTRGCLLALAEIAKARPFVRPRLPAILDIGTGSGVLAIAASLMLRERVVAGDKDPVSVSSARENARLNRARSLVTIVRASGLGDPRLRAARYTMAFANILLSPLKRLAGPLARYAVPRARLVLSGVLQGEGNALLAVYRAHGFYLQRRILLEGWATLVLIGKGLRVRVAASRQPPRITGCRASRRRVRG
jgi:ribosomal protein L11 methyltransferase